MHLIQTASSASHLPFMLLCNGNSYCSVALTAALANLNTSLDRAHTKALQVLVAIIISQSSAPGWQFTSKCCFDTAPSAEVLHMQARFPQLQIPNGEAAEAPEKIDNSKVSSESSPPCPFPRLSPLSTADKSFGQVCLIPEVTVSDFFDSACLFGCSFLAEDSRLWLVAYCCVRPALYTKARLGATSQLPVSFVGVCSVAVFNHSGDDYIHACQCIQQVAPSMFSVLIGG